MTDYDAENEFENYRCFSAVLSGRLKTAAAELDVLSEHDSPEYVQAVVQKVMQPLLDIMEYKIRRYPYTKENLSELKAVCGEQTAEIIRCQKNLYEEYYTLLPVIKSKIEAELAWSEIERAFDDVLSRI